MLDELEPDQVGVGRDRIVDLCHARGSGQRDERQRHVGHGVDVHGPKRGRRRAEALCAKYDQADAETGAVAGLSRALHAEHPPGGHGVGDRDVDVAVGQEAIVIGGVVVSLSSFIGYIPGNFMAVTNKTVNLLTVPIALLFFFALFVPFANAKGVWIATIASVTVAVLIAFSGMIFGKASEASPDPVSFQWISPAALIVGVTVGLVACKLFAKK